MEQQRLIDLLPILTAFYLHRSLATGRYELRINEYLPADDGGGGQMPAEFYADLSLSEALDVISVTLESYAVRY